MRDELFDTFASAHIREEEKRNQLLEKQNELLAICAKSLSMLASENRNYETSDGIIKVAKELLE